MQEKRTRGLGWKVGASAAGVALLGLLGASVKSLHEKLVDDVRLEDDTGSAGRPPAALALDGDALVYVPSTWNGNPTIRVAQRSALGTPRVIRSRVVATLPVTMNGQFVAKLAASEKSYLVALGSGMLRESSTVDGVFVRVDKASGRAERVEGLDSRHARHDVLASTGDGFVLRHPLPRETATDVSRGQEHVVVLRDGEPPRAHRELDRALAALHEGLTSSPDISGLASAGDQVVVHAVAGFTGEQAPVVVGELPRQGEAFRHVLLAAPRAGGAARTLRTFDLLTAASMNIVGTTKDAVWIQLQRPPAGNEYHRVREYVLVPLDGGPDRAHVVDVGSLDTYEAARLPSFVTAGVLVYTKCEDTSCSARALVRFVDGNTAPVKGGRGLSSFADFVAADAHDAFLTDGGDLRRLRL